MEMIYQASTAEGAIDFINMYDLEEAAKEVIPKAGMVISAAVREISLRIEKMKRLLIIN